MYRSDIIGCHRYGLQHRIFFRKHVVRHPVGLTVYAYVRHCIQPLSCGRAEHLEVTDLKSGEQVLLDITHARLNPTFFVARAHITRHDLKAIMTREVEVFWIEHRRCTGQALQHGRLEIVDHNPPGYPATKVSKGIVMAAKEVLHGLRYGELGRTADGCSTVP